MAWDSSLPANDSKIRNLGIEIRPNWTSIEQGEDANAMASTASYLQQYSSAYIERNGRAANTDPTTEADTFYAYCKQDANGVAEGHSKDPAGNVIAITEAGKMGNRATNFYMNSFAFDTTAARVNNQNNIVAAWGYFNSSGVLQYGSGIASGSRSSTGIYTINWTASRFANANYAVTGIGSGNTSFSHGSTRTTAQFGLQVRSVSSGDLKDAAFFVQAVGGQG
jgi:hypothetical protein